MLFCNRPQEDRRAPSETVLILIHLLYFFVLQFWPSGSGSRSSQSGSAHRQQVREAVHTYDNYSNYFRSPEESNMQDRGCGHSVKLMHHKRVQNDINHDSEHKLI